MLPGKVLSTELGWGQPTPEYPEGLRGDRPPQLSSLLPPHPTLEDSALVNVRGLWFVGVTKMVFSLRGGNTGRARQQKVMVSHATGGLSGMLL